MKTEHKLQLQQAGSGDHYNGRCTCGKWTVYPGRWHDSKKKVRKLFAEHAATVADEVKAKKAIAAGQVKAFKAKHARIEKAFDMVREAESILTFETDEIITLTDDDVYQSVYEELIMEREGLIESNLLSDQQVKELEGLFM